MKTTLIKPNMGHIKDVPYIDEGRMEPLQLGLLAGMTPREIEIEIFDDRCEEIQYDRPTDLVAITVESFTAKRAYEISDQYRRRGAKVVLGGVHVTLIPEEATSYADCIIINDAESVWAEMINDFIKGGLKSIYKGAFSETPQADFTPERRFFKDKGYLPITLTQFSRGCIHSCNFCAIHAYFKNKHFFRHCDDVINEIRQQEHKIVFFVDDNIVANPEAAKELFRALIPLQIHWVSQASIDMVYDSELMDLMCESGCRGHVIGFESINPKVLTALNKTPNLLNFNAYEKEIEIIKSYGLQTWAAFLIGHDEDTPESLYDTLRFALRHKFTFAAFNLLMPYPNTVLYQRLREEKRLLFDGKWWLHPEYRFNHAAFKPLHMTAKELTEISFDLRKKWNSSSSIFSRFLDPRTNMRSLENMILYWTYNPIFRREVFKKQNIILGMR